MYCDLLDPSPRLTCRAPTCQSTDSGKPSNDTIRLDSEMPGHLCCPIPPGKKLSGAIAGFSAGRKRSACSPRGLERNRGSRKILGSAVRTYPEGIVYPQESVSRIHRSPPAVCGITLRASLIAHSVSQLREHRPGIVHCRALPGEAGATLCAHLLRLVWISHEQPRGVSHGRRRQ